MIPKFRAWLKREKQMVSVVGISFYQDSFDVEEIFVYDQENPHKYGDLWEEPFLPYEFVLMQSTGLKDCNDREIYEGDVIKVSDGLYEIDEENPFVVVKWDEEAGGYTMKDFTGEFDALNIGWQIADKFVRVEVVGNIYENPEMLEEVEK